MEEIEKLIQELYLDKTIKQEDIPNVDLYVDQIVQLFEMMYSHTKREEDEKVLTKTMINNYTKGKLLPPVKGKKYTKEQIILIQYIYLFKNLLSLQDCKSILSLLPSLDEKESFSTTYDDFLAIYNENEQLFTSTIKQSLQLSSVGEQKEDIETFLQIASLLINSLFYKRMAEKLIDNIQKNK